MLTINTFLSEELFSKWLNSCNLTEEEISSQIEKVCKELDRY